MKKKGKSLISFVAVLLFIVMAGICIMHTIYYGVGDKNAGVTFQDYKITVEDNTYNSGTRTGFIDLSIKGDGSPFEKLFYTSDDVLGNGFDFIVDDECLLRVSQGSAQLKCRAYETAYKGRTQYLRIYYISGSHQIKEDSVDVEIVYSGEDKVEQNVPVKLKVDEEYISSGAGEGMNEMRVSATGILYPNIVSYKQPYMTSGTMAVDGKDAECLLAIDQNVQAGKIGGKEVIKPKLRYEPEYDEGSIIYAVELENWKQIEQISFGDSGFYFTEEAKERAAKEEKEAEEAALQDRGRERGDFTGDKETVMNQMLNAIDHYTTVQGTFCMKGRQLGCETEASVEYRIDKETSYSYERVRSADIDWTALADGSKETVYYHAQKAYRTAGRTMEDESIVKMDVNERVRPQAKDIDHYRNNITDLYYATYSVYPQSIAFTYLFDPDRWEIVGEEAVAGRNCWKIEGKGEDYLNPVNSIALWIDKEAGCVLQYKGYEGRDEDRTEVEYLMTDSITYDEAVTPVELDGTYSNYADWS